MLNDTSFSIFSGIAGQIQQRLRFFSKNPRTEKPQPANIMKARNPNGLQFILSYPS
ncbi:hypothetical protein AGRO_2969 [Agrobacterium sp. ATCC 31749]|uniref:hypothetical protein n=1 Tax=Agrobacterium TaxID=357 RepID=UPI00020DB3DC|nr:MULTISPECIES: hypothetical protein [Agrobacterium]KJX89606.1 hypothetical protein SY94_0374 [Agrobacterium tumefaciens]EGL64328.1 hypothetical protein AGRO_2969 [Agrobacterium sp. ATCC 31749]NMV68828.1 hypothetical protein [Agrobacterium fabrum]QKW95754.1 hypothetical protein GSF67_00720 [Agrobacterium sp. CGMCC 11546]QQN07186.1 hypothetical protein EML4058_00810 [Agrobacterium fabrum]